MLGKVILKEQRMLLLLLKLLRKLLVVLCRQLLAQEVVVILEALKAVEVAVEVHSQNTPKKNLIQKKNAITLYKIN
jgi:hypothetical protein